jgi:IS5 family transposase
MQIKAGLERLISHLKHDHRLLRNYLSGTGGDQINTLITAATYDMRKWMRIKRGEIINLIFCLFSRTHILFLANIKS